VLQNLSRRDTLFVMLSEAAWPASGVVLMDGSGKGMLDSNPVTFTLERYDGCPQANRVILRTEACEPTHAKTGIAWPIVAEASSCAIGACVKTRDYRGGLVVDLDRFKDGFSPPDASAAAACSASLPRQCFGKTGAAQ
jgi:hypothetical protein